MKDAEDKKYAALLSEQQVELDDDIAKCEQHLAAFKRKIAALDANPEASFLPLGTVVRFVGVPDYESSFSLSDDRKSYPVAGSIGVVTGLNRKGEYSICVSMRNEYKTG